MLPHVIRFNAEVVSDLYTELAGEAGLLDGDRSAAAEVIGKRITRLMQIAGLPTTLSACGISPGIFPVLAEEAAEQWTGRFNPRPVTQSDLLHLYEAAI
jgi:alcohol dehydrogenase